MKQPSDKALNEFWQIIADAVERIMREEAKEHPKGA
jgi:hypothetical protein